MKVEKRTVLNILLFAFILSFFVTPLGYHGKVLLNRLIAPNPVIASTSQPTYISSYNWKLKDENWDYFNFEKEKNKIVFINFWASWRLPSAAELKDIQNLYDEFKDQISFYIITDEERPPVEEFMSKNKFTFPVTYQIIGEPAPLTIPEPPSTYILDRDGKVVVDHNGIADWDSNEFKEFIKGLIAQGE